MLEGDQSPLDPLMPQQLYRIVDSVPAEVDKEVKPTSLVIHKNLKEVNYKVIPSSMNAIP